MPAFALLRRQMTEVERDIWQLLRLKGTSSDAKCRLAATLPISSATRPGWSWRMVANTIARHAAKPSEPSSAKRGYRILGFWNNEILANLDRVHHMIAAALAGTPPPNLPHQGGGLYRPLRCGK
jgi:hypothetical protein